MKTRLKIVWLRFVQVMFYLACLVSLLVMFAYTISIGWFVWVLTGVDLMTRFLKLFNGPLTDIALRLVGLIEKES